MDEIETLQSIAEKWRKRSMDIKQKLRDDPWARGFAEGLEECAWDLEQRAKTLEKAAKYARRNSYDISD